MNLRFCPGLTSSELCLNAADAQTSQQGAEWRVSSGNRGNSHLCLDVTSSDAFCPGSNRHELTITEGVEPLDIWAAIKPGHVREKIAMFGSAERWLNGNRMPSPGVTWDRDGGVSGLCRVRKSKGNWGEKGGAKRQRHLANEQNVLWDLSTQKPYRGRVDWSPGSAGGGGAEGEGEEVKMSVLEMVACLEKRFHQQPRDPKPAPLPHKPASFTLLRAPPTDPHSIRVSAMVTRLESDRLRVDANSRKRTVGRVLLTTADGSSAPSRPSSSAPPAPQNVHEELLTTCLATLPAVGSGDLAANQKAHGPSSQSEEAEPPPGLLFWTRAPPQAFAIPDLSCSPCPEGGATEREGGGSEREGGARPCSFLEARRRLQQLLEPQPFLLLLPPHLLLHILALLPTRSLAALKSTCRYFRLVIDTYGVRPADSLWVRAPGYRDDPCKQCRKRCVRGDVSLCRWHHKPFCQAPPHGPGFWMCCRSNRKDTPGCNVGLHDNRWVPAFHSGSVPVYRWSTQEE